jgi:hypothetical protein
MRGPDHKQSSLFSYTNIEDRIAVDHPLRRVKVMADMVLHSMSPTFDSLYAEGGARRLPPSACFVPCCCNACSPFAQSGR